MESLKNFSNKFIEYCYNLDKLNNEELKKLTFESTVKFQQVTKNRNDTQNTIYLINNILT